MLLHVARRLRRPEDARAVQRHANEVLDEARRHLSQPSDVESIQALYWEICKALRPRLPDQTRLKPDEAVPG
jgi:hypothetical protein